MSLFGVQVKVDPHLPEDKIYVLDAGSVPPLSRKPDESSEDYNDRWMKHAVVHGAILMVNNLEILKESL